MSSSEQKEDSLVAEDSSQLESEKSSSSPTAMSTSESNGNPKLYKTTLCQYYLRGSCNNGDKCNFAHGTDQLRSTKPLPKNRRTKYKSILCTKFVTDGYCPVGQACLFAHGVKDLRPATSASSDFSTGHEGGTNPNYKTILCNSFMNGVPCSFADKCQYAHGHHELRERPPTSSLSEEDKQKRLQKLKAMPGYKSKLCTNFDSSGSCEYNELCYYAHGIDELRDDQMSTDECREQGAGGSIKGPTKTRQFASSHGKTKTILCKTFSKNGNCPYGANCSFAHGVSELRAAENSRYKTVLCKSTASGMVCPHGARCLFAHSKDELRPSSSLGGSTGRMKQPIMCRSVQETGYCMRGNACLFSHTPQELMAANGGLGGNGQPSLDPKYKTVLCEAWKKSGRCQWENNCKFAHGPVDLNHQVPYVIPSVFPSAYNPMLNYKTSLCRMMSTIGHCPRGQSCTFAHSLDELQAAGPSGASKRKQQDLSRIQSPGPSTNATTTTNTHLRNQYKTELCQNFVTFGKCPYNEVCHFAHGEAELNLNKRLRI